MNGLRGAEWVGIWLLVSFLAGGCGGLAEDRTAASGAKPGAGSSGGLGGSGGAAEGRTAGSGAGGNPSCSALGGSCQSPDLPCSEESVWHGRAVCGDLDNNSCCVPQEPINPPVQDACQARFTGLVILRDDFWDTYGQELLVDPETCLGAGFDFDAMRVRFENPEDRARLWEAGFPLPDGDRVVARVALDGRANDSGGDTYAGELEVTCIQQPESVAKELHESCFE